MMLLEDDAPDEEDVVPLPPLDALLVPPEEAVPLDPPLELLLPGSPLEDEDEDVPVLHAEPSASVTAAPAIQPVQRRITM